MKCYIIHDTPRLEGQHEIYTTEGQRLEDSVNAQTEGVQLHHGSRKSTKTNFDWTVHLCTSKEVGMKCVRSP